MAGILHGAFISEYNVKDSKTFCQYVSQLEVSEDHVLVSFDAVSLFTNNVTKRAVTHDVIIIWDSIKGNTENNLDLFVEIIEFCMDVSFFCFRGRYFHQKSGTAMGSPLSPVLADIVLENLISRTLRVTQIPANHIRKYVDDLFLVLHKHQIDDVLNTFNLDMLLIRTNEGRVMTDWYAKPMASGRLLNFFSFHPMDQKLGVVAGFIDRVRSLSTVRTDEQKNQLMG